MVSIDTFEHALPDRCNACCNRNCKGDMFTDRFNRIQIQDCHGYMPIQKSFRLAELAIAHPTHLHDSLVKLPFKVRIDNYLKYLR